MEPYVRFRWRRFWRRQKRFYKNLIPSGRELFYLHILRRWRQWKHIRRFVFSWLALITLMYAGLWQQTISLKPHFQTAGPAAGGTYVEGIVGEIPSLNPMFPENSISLAVNELVFNGLMRYDGAGQLVGDLATDWQTSRDGTRYIITIRDDVVWHDGEPLTAGDVVFTFSTMAAPDARSPLIGNWRDITVTALDAHTVQFDLPNPFTPFLHSLTTGIVPQHRLASVPLAQLRTTEFNQQPVGTGPFKFEELRAARQEIVLAANGAYFRGRPRLDSFVIKAAANNDQLVQFYQSGQVTAVGDMSVTDLDKVEDLTDSQLLRAPLSSEVLAFFKTNNPILEDAKVRQALVRATRPTKISQALDLRVRPADAPLLPEHAGYADKLAQLTPSQPAAAQLLEQAGWKMGPEGIRQQGDTLLSLRLVTQNNDTYPAAAMVLQQDWAAVGVRLKVDLVNQQELQQSFIRPRNYDILLVGINVGADPDVYPYWHSSQARDPGLNLSLYKSDIADEALEAGRTRPNGALREAKYQTFLRQWRKHAPAVVLYRPLYFYATLGQVRGVEFERLVSPAARFHNVHNWTVQTQPTLKRLLPSKDN